MSTLPARLRAARAFAGLTQPELAEKIELGQVTYALSEKGQRETPRRELLAIAEACEVPMWFLEGGWEGWRAKGPGASEVDAEGRAALADLEHPGSSGARPQRGKGSAAGS